MLLTLALLAPVGVLGAPQTAAAAACKKQNAEPTTISTKRASRAVTCLVNAKRRNHGLSALQTRSDLKEAAKDHSRYMERHGCFEHICPGESDLVQRIRSSGYLGDILGWGVGENIAWGSGSKGTPKQIVKAWMHSPGHRANILDPKYEHIGVGTVWGSPKNPSAKAGLFTADFGFRVG